jgi:hypothetical protein
MNISHMIFLRSLFFAHLLFMRTENIRSGLGRICFWAPLSDIKDKTAGAGQELEKQLEGIYLQNFTKAEQET